MRPTSLDIVDMVMTLEDEFGICPAGEDIHVQLRGGVLTIRVLPGRQLLMTGAAETVCEGTTEV